MSKRSHQLGMVAFACLFAVCLGSRARAQFSLRVLGGGAAMAVSGDGTTVVGQGPNGVPYVWSSHGGGTPLVGTTADSPLGASSDGFVIVGAGSGSGAAARWINRVYSPLSIPGMSGQVVAVGVSAQGSVIAGYGPNGPGGGGGAYYWDADGTSHRIIADPSATVAQAFGVSRDGTTVIGESLHAGTGLGQIAFRYRVGGSPTFLGGQPGFAGSAAYGCSLNGDVVVGEVTNDAGVFPVRWGADGQMTVLPLDVGDQGGCARAVSADGSIAVGYFFDCLGGPRHAALWIGTTQAIRIEDLLTSAGINLGASPLLQAWGISDDGTVVVGEPGAWIATLPGLRTMIGACCRGATCSSTIAAGCSGAGSVFLGGGTACNPGNNSAPCCRADFNQSGGLSVQDIFDYLNAWFVGDSRARFDDPCSLSVQDIFDFLAAWFAGC
jgi:uncharacterized membrane protein